MNDDKKALWNSVCKTDPDHVKKITGKSYQGSSPKPYYLIERATDTFGPCGIGWGIDVIEERFFNFSDTEIHHFATVEFWYVLDGKRGTVRQMGGTRAAYITSTGKFTCDEDAPKKSITDGMVKAMSMVGFAGDIFGGRWDDSKYQDELKAEKEKDAEDKAGAEKEAARIAQRTPEYNAAIEKHEATISAVISGINNSLAARDINDIDAQQSFLSLAAEAWYTMANQDDLEKEQKSIWLAYTKGGVFTTQQQAIIKSSDFRIAHFGAG